MTIEFRYKPGDQAIISPCGDMPCRVLRCIYSTDGNSYEVSYWMDGKQHTTAVFEDELTED